MPASKQDRYAAALIARGYTETKGTGKYRKLLPPGNPRMRLNPGSDRSTILLGGAGAIRVTSGPIAGSISISGASLVQRLLEEGAALLNKKKIEEPQPAKGAA
jgi:hypothetical protein